MKLKSTFLLFVLYIAAGQLSQGQSAGNTVVDQLLSAWSPRSFTAEPVTDQQIELILKCGIKAPSARNNQPWKFTVVRDEAIMKDIIGNVVAGNILIIVSGLESQEGRTPDFDCGLATQNMFIAATSLGLGARIYGGPASAANGKRDILQIPAGYKVVIILRIGNLDKGVDAVSGASPRKSKEEIVNWVK